MIEACTSTATIMSWPQALVTCVFIVCLAWVVREYVTHE